VTELFALALLPSSIAVFAWALRRTKITGTLTHSESAPQCGTGLGPSALKLLRTSFSSR
jgi:hypothetical protein